MVMDDEEFVRRIKEKIQRLTAREVDLVVDPEAADSVVLEMNEDTLRVVMGADLLKHAGLVRMAIEYVVACVKEGRELQPLEFQLRLRRN
jgi:hypothetical protein